MKRFNLLFICLLFFTLQSFSQIVTFKVLDQSSKPLEFAAATMYDAKDSSFIKGEISDIDGRVNFSDLKSGQYFISISFIGFENGNIAPFTYEGKTIDLGPMTLAAATQVIKEVTVSAKKPVLEIRADKMVLNPEASISMAGLNGLELLRKAPGVVIDNNENIQLKGKNGVLIYLDGKPTNLTAADLANVLKGLSSSDIEAVEIITNPSAKYDAQGNAGIINVKLKKNKNFGTNGRLNLSGGYGEFHKANGSISLNNRNKKVNMFGTLGGGNSKWYNEMGIKRTQDGKTFDMTDISTSQNNPINAKFGMDYFANAKHTFGVLINGYTQYRDNNERHINNTFISNARATRIDSVLDASSNETSRSFNSNINLNYKYADTSGNELTFDVDYGYFDRREDNLQPNEYKLFSTGAVLNTRTFTISSPTTINIYTVKSDYTKDLKSLGWQISSGFKYAKVVSDNTFVLSKLVDQKPIRDINQSNDFGYDEAVSAIYLNANGKISSKLNGQFGLRMENTNSVGDLVRDPSQPKQSTDLNERNYTDFFPSGALTYTMNPNNVLNLSYSRRLDRPNYQNLNPFEYRIDELTFRKGNPMLRPQYNNNLELTYTAFQAANIGISYSKSKDEVTDIIERDPLIPNKTFIIFRNINNREQYSLSINSPLPIKKWWNGFASLTVSQTFFEAAFENYSFSTKTPIAYNAYGESNFTLTKDINFEISGWFNSASIWGGTFITEPQGSLDLGARMKLNDGNTSLKLTFTDLLRTANWNMTSNAVPGLDMVGRGLWESRRLNINISHSFGSKSIKGSRQRKTGMEAEAGRIGG
jgi:iron complex outermembrane recepter protein